MTQNWVRKEQKFKFLTARLRDILWFGKWHPFKHTKTKNKRHFFISTFDKVQLCFFVQKDSFTLNVLKMQFFFGWDYENLVKMNNAAPLWSIFLSLSQRQIAFLGHLEWSNIFGQKFILEVIKSWYKEVVSVFCFCLFKWMPFSKSQNITQPRG